MWLKSPSIFLKLSFYALLVSVPFGIRHGFSLSGVSFLISLGEVLLAVLCAAFLIEFGWPRGIWPRSLVGFLGAAAFSILIASAAGVAIHAFLVLCLAVFGAIVTAKLLRQGLIRLEGIAAALAISGIAQAVIGYLQFWKQGALGLGFFGEAAISQSNPDTAKVVVEGSKLIRASGTLPHANIYAAFLILGLLALYYLWLRRPSELAPTPIGKCGSLELTSRLVWGWKGIMSDALLGVGIFVTWLGLLVSFSRGGWIIAAVMMALTVGHAIVTRQFFRQGVRLAILLVAIFLILYSQFLPYISSRAQFSSGEPSVALRVTYDKLGLGIIRSHLLGVGIGNQVRFAKESGAYAQFGLTEHWQQQPIHNLYLLIGAETGVLGLLAFLWFLMKIFTARTSSVIPKAMLLSLLLFGLIDHFLWTSVPGILMLWLTAGFVIGLNMASESARS